MFGGAANDGVFRQDEVYQESPASPTIASDGSPLVDSLEVAFQSPGHMRVARVKRDPRKHPGQPGHIEYQEQFRQPTAEELEILKEQGVVKVGPGNVLLSGLGEPGPVSSGMAPGVLAPAPGVPTNGLVRMPGQPSILGKVVKYGAIIGGVGLVSWLGYKFAWPVVADKLFSGGGGGGGGRDDDDGDGDE